MSCFWDSILNKVRIEDFQKIFNHSGKPNPETFAKMLIKENVKTENVLWNSQILKEQQLQENYEHIQEFNVSNVNQGYDCSTCDPFLLIICELFEISIQHVYLGKTIEYTHKKNVFNNNYTIKLQSDKGHMW